ncbi:hypothetical protein L1887_39383 [Cichorium endivia]|nr:hypothetical protein L1887_39383 [Cichorium endivia]
MPTCTSTHLPKQNALKWVVYTMIDCSCARIYSDPCGSVAFFISNPSPTASLTHRFIFSIETTPSHRLLHFRSQSFLSSLPTLRPPPLLIFPTPHPHIPNNHCAPLRYSTKRRQHL